MRGIGEPQRQIGEDGLGVSSTPETLPMEIGPIEIGNRHSQQTSEIGLTNRPVQDCAEAAPDHRTAARTSAARGARRRIMPGLPVRRRHHHPHRGIRRFFRRAPSRGQDVDQALPSRDDDLGDRPVVPLPVGEPARRDPALDHDPVALLQHRLHRLDRRAVDDDPVPLRRLGGASFRILPLLGGGKREDGRPAALLQVADLRIAPGMAQQGGAVDVQHGFTPSLQFHRGPGLGPRGFR